MVTVAQSSTDAPVAELRMLDRTSGKLQDIRVANGATVALGTLRVTLNGCRYPRGAINSNAYASLSITDTLIEETIFEGWMVASAPALNALEHSRYDVWVIRCRTS